MGVEELEGIRRHEILRSQIDSRTVASLMSEEFETADPEEPLFDVLAKMKATGLHEMPVIENGRTLVGVINLKSVLKRKNLSVSTKARSVLENMPEIGLDTPITQVAEALVSTGCRQLPVLKKNKVIGVITRADIVRFVPEIKDLRNVKVGEVMTREVETVNSRDPLGKALEIMKDLDIRSIPVLNGNGSVTGMIGVKEVIDYNWRQPQRQTVGELAGRSAPIDLAVGSLAIDSPFTIGPEASLNDAVELMVLKSVSSLPVLEDERLNGILTMYDIVELVASFRERDMVYVQITGLEEEERYSLDEMEKEIQAELAKIARITHPMLMTLHVSKYNSTGNTAKYSLSGRLITERKLFIAKAVDWDILRATIELMARLKTMVNEMKEEKLDIRKRKSRA